MALRITWANIEGLKRFEDAIEKLDTKSLSKIATLALNRTGDMARTQVRRELTKQTGLQRATIVRAVRTFPAQGGLASAQEYRLEAKGGNISLKHFKARETRPGVSAAPWGKREVFHGTFMRAGWVWSKRIAKPKWNGQVFERYGGKTSTGMDRFHKVKSGLYLPKELVKGATAQAFETTAAKVLPKRIEHELRRLTGGVIG